MLNTKFRLLNISLEASLAEPLQDFIDVLLIFQLILRVYYNIIQIGRIEVVKVVKEYIVYITLVRSQSVSQPKRKYLIFIRSVTGLKYLKILRPGVYSNSVEGLADIELYKDLSSTYLGQSLVKQRQRVAVLAGYIIQLTVVNIEAECYGTPP